jgi:serine/threonine-protein kinase
MADAAPFGRYLLRDRLARGGMGEVFRAVAVGANGFEKPVIVKRIHPRHAGAQSYVDAFVAEAKRMSLLAHPNIVQVIDFGVGVDADYFLVLELVDGLDLERLAKSFTRRAERFPLDLALFVADGVLRGLHHAHTQRFPDGVGLVHRDVSPSNVLVSKVGEVKVADFGVALVAEPEGETQPTGVVGKMHYMAPEQFDAGAVDARADVFAFGVSLFELLTGELPFTPKDALAYRLAITQGEAQSLRALRPDAPAELEALIARALAPRPEDRFESARAMAKSLDALVGADLRRATADDLADAVARAVAEAPAPKRVVRLAAPVREPSTFKVEPVSQEPVSQEPVSQEPSNEAPNEEVADDALPEQQLTRELKDGNVVFTRKLTEAPQPSASLPFASPPEHARAVDRRWIAVAIASLAFGVVLALRIVRTDGPVAAAPLPSASSASAALASPDLSATASSAPTEAISPSPSTSIAAPIPTSHGTIARPSTSTSARPGSATDGSVSAGTNGACRGAISLFASHAWVVSGGPSTIEAPGRYDWPCGHFSLHAVSRTDAAEKSRAVVIQAGAPAVVDLR